MRQAIMAFQNLERRKEELPAMLPTTYD
jgi:hypothetical protein